MAQWVVAQFRVDILKFHSARVSMYKNSDDAGDLSVLLSPRNSLAYSSNAINHRSEFDQ